MSREHPICDVCGKPLVCRVGRRHIGCQSSKTGAMTHDAQSALQRLENQTKDRLSASVRRWDRSMGRAKLLEMFPDMAGRMSP